LQDAADRAYIAACHQHRHTGRRNDFDLPGAGNNPVNTQPVVVLQDLPGTDEGRGMGQIGYKMAPKARIGFATANGGEVTSPTTSGLSLRYPVSNILRKSRRALRQT
jgi:hypothetical protein